MTRSIYLPLHQQAVVWGVRDGVHVVQRPDDYFQYKLATMDD